MKFVKYEAQLKEPIAKQVAETLPIAGGYILFARAPLPIAHDAPILLTIEAVSEDTLRGLAQFPHYDRDYGVLKGFCLEGGCYLADRINIKNSSVTPWFRPEETYGEWAAKILGALTEPLPEPLPSWQRDLKLNQRGALELTTDLYQRLTSPDTNNVPFEYDRRIIHYLRKRLLQWYPSVSERDEGARHYIEGTLNQLQEAFAQYLQPRIEIDPALDRVILEMLNGEPEEDTDTSVDNILRDMLKGD